MRARHLKSVVLGVLLSATLLGSLAPRADAATIIINNTNAAGVGFNDPAPRAPVGGNPGTTLGAQRLYIFNYAASIWGSILPDAVTITVNASFAAQTCTATSATLGSTSSLSSFRDFPGAPVAGHWYQQSIANKLANTDLDLVRNDMQITFNLNIDSGCFGPGQVWYYGTDGIEGTNIELLPVVLHEIGHGLGFATLTNGSTGNYSGGFPTIYDKFLLDKITGLHWDQNTAAQRAASAIALDKLVWDGANAVAQAATYLTIGQARVLVNAPGGIAGSNYTAQDATFGAALTEAGFTGNVVQLVDSLAPVNDGCETIVNAAALAGNIALIDRGVCTFAAKCAAAQAAGAVGVIIVNNVAAGLPGMGGSDPSITIPCVGISQADGNTIKANLAAGVNVTIGRDPVVKAGMDAAGRIKMYTPNPFAGGSSVSHWDISLTPNALMEPAINNDLHDTVDLTNGQMRDIGWFPPPVVTVTSPNGGESWLVGSNQSIAWTATENTPASTADIDYSTDGGATYPNVIAAGITNTGSYAWTVPNTPTTQARVRVTVHDAGGTGSDASNADFALRDPVITASAGPNGSIAPSGPVSVTYGTDQSFTITADACAHIADVLVDGASVGAVTGYTFTNVQTDHTIAASFAVDLYTITASAGAGGSIAPSGAVPVACGTDQSFTITADACQSIADVLVDGVSVGAVASYTFTNVQADHTIAASFTQNSYTITASASAGGAIDPSGAVAVLCGADQAFTITPDTGYHVLDVLVDGGSVGAVTAYTFTNVQADHTIAASFEINSYTLTVTVVGNGTVTRSPDLPFYPHGTAVTLEATPGDGWAFAAWSGDITGTANPLTVSMGHDLNLTATFVDVVAPTVQLISPNGGERLVVGAVRTVDWTATDNAELTVDLFVSRDNGVTFEPIATGLPNTGSYDWVVTGPGTDDADDAMTNVLTVVARDGTNSSEDVSDAGFEIINLAAGISAALPSDFALAPPSPNPSHGPAMIAYAVPRDANVKLRIVDVQGREVVRLVDGLVPAGRYQVRWNGAGSDGRFLSGVFFVRMESGPRVFTRRLAMVR